jgi:limonene-1,2-epoxide hydrolase
VVFYLGRDAVDEDEVVTRVGNKATWKVAPICHCFGHTAFSLALDLEANDGVSTVRTDLLRVAADGSIACERLNPSGGCCLAAIDGTLESIRQFTTL